MLGFLPLLAVVPVEAQGAPASVPATLAATMLASPDTLAPRAWEFSASAQIYSVPDDRDFIQPTVTADHGTLHLEARYNYEAIETASVWLGVSTSGGTRLAWTITPMIGGVFGSSAGVAPGYELSLAWKQVELYSEGEYLFDIDSTADDYFYNWAELSFAAADWWRAGIITQRTRAYHAERELQRGLLLGGSYRAADLTIYWLDPDKSDSTVMASVGASF